MRLHDVPDAFKFDIVEGQKRFFEKIRKPDLKKLL